MEPLLRQHETIGLLPAEKLLRQLLLDCRDDMTSADPDLPELKIWFVGGWVRDKLLSITNSDIDIALSTMTGTRFANALQAFFARNSTKYKQEAQNIGVPSADFNVHTVACKPEQSKHLETGIIHIFGLDVDLVNLRRETYTNEDNRIPDVDCGTAEEDALRRDITINALYYNLDKQQLEDFTGNGLKDMTTGIIRTPLQPHQTFMDDPLRILRVIRFASRLGYTIENSTKQSMKTSEIHTTFRAKIRRERVGIEVTKMMNDRNPLTAFQLIYELDLYSTVFLTSDQRRDLSKLLPYQRSDSPWPYTWSNAFQLLTVLLKDTTSLGRELTQSQKSENFWMMVAYAPIAELGRTNPEEAVKNMRDAIRPKNEVSKLLQQAFNHMDNIRSTVNLVATDEWRRSTVGMAIRSWGVTWRLQVLYSLLAEAVYAVSDGWLAVHLSRYSSFVEAVSRQRLQDAPVVKPILDGDDVIRIFKLHEGGGFMKAVIDALVRWQFDNERSCSKEKAEEWLRTQKQILGIP